MNKYILPIVFIATTSQAGNLESSFPEATYAECYEIAAYEIGLNPKEMTGIDVTGNSARKLHTVWIELHHPTNEKGWRVYCKYDSSYAVTDFGYEVIECGQ